MSRSRILLEELNGTEPFQIIPNVSFSSKDKDRIKFTRKLEEFHYLAKKTASGKFINAREAKLYQVENAEHVMVTYAYFDPRNNYGWVHLDAQPLNIPII